MKIDEPALILWSLATMRLHPARFGSRRTQELGGSSACAMLASPRWSIARIHAPCGACTSAPALRRKTAVSILAEVSIGGAHWLLVSSLRKEMLDTHGGRDGGQPVAPTWPWSMELALDLIVADDR